MRYVTKLALAAMLLLFSALAFAQAPLTMCIKNDPNDCLATPVDQTQTFMYGFEWYLENKVQPLRDDIAALQNRVTALEAALANTATTSQVSNLQQQIAQLQQQVAALQAGRPGEAVAWYTRVTSSVYVPHNLTRVSSMPSLNLRLQFNVPRPDANYVVVIGDSNNSHCEADKFTAYVEISCFNSNAHTAVEELVIFDHP